MRKRSRAKCLENFPAPPHIGPGKSCLTRTLYFLRKLADLQVSSVLIHLVPWLKSLSGDVLEIGCGAQPYRHLLPEMCNYHCLDSVIAAEAFGYTMPDVTYYNGAEFPFPSASFDYLFHTEVLEHVYEARAFLAQCRRVLRDGGQMFFSVPFQARYHYIPHDYWRFTPAALERILAESGFQTEVIHPRGTDLTVAAYKVLGVIYRLLSGTLMEKLVGVLSSPVAILSLCIGHLSMRWQVGSQHDCLGYCVVATAQGAHCERSKAIPRAGKAEIASSFHSSQ